MSFSHVCEIISGIKGIITISIILLKQSYLASYNYILKTTILFLFMKIAIWIESQFSQNCTDKNSHKSQIY